jgi:hypothetical protein
MFKLNGIVGYLHSMSFERITFEEHVYYRLEALHLRFSVLGFSIIDHYSGSSY